ncbi:Transcription factor MYB98 [Hibiscus syriacus]|uniref:Transcription factor MYB98 n=1 Tax=Hibiscus syriacus TaxID=106335 RepID=A0A6A3CGN1_HIBSY|nr:Transcription factor MYB98 [Hibiscus syriacus]
MSPQGQQPMLLSDNCLKPFEGPSSSSKDYYLQDFDHLDHGYVNGTSSSNHVFLYDAFPYSCSVNNADLSECKPLAAAGHGQLMDNLGCVNLFQQRNSSSDVIMPFDFLVVDESGYYNNKKRVLANWKGRRKSNLVKGQWTMEEDRVLIQLVEQYGVRKWSHIAQMLPGRIGKQCRERWHNHLRPHIKGVEEEDKVLIQSHMEIGNKWAEIAKRFPGRTENSIKNHWNATKRRQFPKRKCRSRGSILQE